MKSYFFRKQFRVFFILLVIFSIYTTSGHAEEIEFTFTSSYDGTEQLSASYIPDGFDAEKEYPLLVIAHYMGGSRFTPKNQGFYPECDKRGYLLVCPELHGHRTGGATSLASLEAQHDIIDAINYMKEHYQIDTSRIYCAGRSMGGMLSQIMAGKYPDLFAAVVSGQGISDLRVWMETTTPRLREMSEKETGPYSAETAFDYARRSSISYAPNLSYVPLILWHGTNDTWVPPEQSENLTETIRQHNRFQPDVNWLLCAPHVAANFSPGWVCDQLKFYQNKAESGDETPVRFFPELKLVIDETKRIYWLDIIPANNEAFAYVTATISDDTLSIRTDNVSKLVVDMEYVSKLVHFSTYNITSDIEMRFSIKKGNTTMFETTAYLQKSGPVPDNVFEK